VNPFNDSLREVQKTEDPRGWSVGVVRMILPLILHQQEKLYAIDS